LEVFVFKNLDNSKGTHHRTTKKVFCRMLKTASLVTTELDSGQE
jgi:hypothetical protein